MKVAVTGAYSYTGKYITRRLLSAGHEVTALTGHPGRPDPFDRAVRAHPLDFENETALVESLQGASTLVDTYWIRFDRGANTQAGAVNNTRTLLRAAKAAGVRRVIQISITNPSRQSPLPYFRGKAEIEQLIEESGLSYAILRPTVLFGREDVLINNIAYLLRRSPIFGVPGDGSYRLQPVYVDDVAALAAEAVSSTSNYKIDTVGPDIFTFRELIELIEAVLGLKRPILSLPPSMALLAANLIGGLVGDVLLTNDEIRGLMANLLVSQEPPRCHTRLEDWLRENRSQVGMQYASELRRHYRQ